MKRLLIFAAYYYPHVGGYEKNVHELNKRLVALGYEVNVVTCNSDKSPVKEMRDGVHIYRLPAWNALGGTYPIPKLTPTTCKILRRLSREKFNLVHTQTRFFITSFMGFVFAKIKKLPLVHTERGTRHSVTSNKLLEAIGKTYDHTLGSMIVRRALKNIGVSQAACDFIRHLGAKNPIVIHNGINTRFFKKTPSDVRRRMGLEGVVVITFVGRIIYAKGIHDLIDAFAQVKKQLPSTKLLIVGDGPYLEQLKKLANQAGCGSDIFFLGQKDQKEVIDILSVSDIFVNPSYSEGLPTSVMEAASIGLPIVATDVGGTREIIEHGKSGIIIEPGQPSKITEALLSLIHNHQMASELGAAAKRRLRQKFDWGQIVDSYVEIYNAVSVTNNS